jgi:hypothetical protein
MVFMGSTFFKSLVASERVTGEGISLTVSPVIKNRPYEVVTIVGEAFRVSEL